MRLAALFSWLTRRPKPTPACIHVYSRQGCHLCDEAWEQLEKQQHRYHFTLATTDVDTDPELAACYGDSVPVVTVNGKVRFRGRINLVLLERLLRAETPEPGPE